MPNMQRSKSAKVVPGKLRSAPWTCGCFHEVAECGCSRTKARPASSWMRMISRQNSKRTIDATRRCSRRCRGICFQVKLKSLENQVQGGSRNTIFGRRRTISVRRFARCCSKDKSHPVAKSVDKSPRKPSVAVCSKILGGEDTSMTSSCKAPPRSRPR